ncbi:MAG: S1C family serine protease [Rubrivivax sp.]|nr:S1C family serine protease [Rubrivivax sp.]
MKPIIDGLRGWVLAALAAAAGFAGAAADTGSAIEAQSRALQRASDAVVGLRALAVEDARSAATLGRARQGSGVVIDADGLVLTIGYLVLEAEQVMLSTDDGRNIPARVVAYDLATGFGLVQALVPLKLAPVPLGDAGAAPAAAADGGSPLLVVSGGDTGAVGATRLVSRRAFAGYWEYHIDGALFTAPPRPDHGGAGLFNERGELLGIGSLFVADALGPGQPPRPGNMFVPVDLLKPILGELRQRGSSSASRRAWLGVNCVEHEGELRVLRVAEDSPADLAGVLRGDRVLAIDGTPVAGLAQLWKALWADVRTEREVALDIERGGQRLTLKLQSVDRARTLRRAQGI